MKKVEYVRLFQGIAKEKGLELTHGEIDVVLESLEELVVEIFNARENANIGGFLKVEVSERGERTGVANLGDNVGQEWTSPAAYVPKVKLVKSFVDKHRVNK